MSELILSRDVEGKVKICGDKEINFSVPLGESVLGILNSSVNNIPSDGENFSGDGYVYDSEGNCDRKWFSVLISGDKPFYYWHPKENDLSYCELKRWKSLEYYNRSIEKIKPERDLIRSLIEKEDFSYYLDNGATAQGYIDFKNYEDGFGWNWSDKNKPKFPLNKELGDRYFSSDKRVKQLSFRSYIFNRLFRRAIDRKYVDIFCKDKSQIIHSVINGRSYWLSFRENGEYYVNVFSYPEKTLVDKVS